MKQPSAQAAPSGLERILFVSDIHAPFHDRRAWALMLRSMGGFLPNRVIVGGDLADFYAVSKFSKDPARLRETNFAEEVAAANTLLDDLAELGAEHYHFIAGNHEARFDAYLRDKAPELVGLAGLTTPQLFRLRTRGWSWTPYLHDMRIGKMNFTHCLRAAGPTAHIKARDKYQGNVVIGHTHHMGIDFLGNVKGEVHVGAVFGHMADLKYVDYTHRLEAMQWTKGFGIGYHDLRRGHVFLVPCPIVSGRVLVDGLLYS
jgi:predicted phosphodiesterase